MAACMPPKLTVETIFSADYWQEICPHLHVADATKQQALLAAAAPCCCSDTATATVRRRLIDEGYASLKPDAVQWCTSIEALAEGARCLAAHGWPATALAMYDESWALGRDAAELMRRATGNAPVMDTLGFFVDPLDGYRGFSPHRDRQPEDWMSRGMAEDPRTTFRTDGTAKYTTVWIALTAANSDSSCLHFVPAQHDPGYYVGDMNQPENDNLEQDPMKLCFPNKESYQHIRAVSLEPGGASMHTHRTIHWGSTGRKGEDVSPRISMSFSFADPEFEPPYISTPDVLPFPKLELRVALLSAQLINYSSLGGTDYSGWKAVAGPLAPSASASELHCGWVDRLRLLHSAFQSQAAHFDSSYKAEIVAKYVAASAEAVAVRDTAEVHQAAAPTNGKAHHPDGSQATGGHVVAVEGCETETDRINKEQKLKDEREGFAGDDLLGSQNPGCNSDAGDSSDQDDDGAETGGFFGGKYAAAWSKADEEAEEDVLDEALDALLDAEVEGAGQAYVNRFTDDFDVLAAQADVAGAEKELREKDTSAATAAEGTGDRKRRKL